MFTNNNFILSNKKKSTNTNNTNNINNINNYDLPIQHNHNIIHNHNNQQNEYIVNDNEFPSELESTFNSESESESTESSEYKEDEKKYWEFGNRGIKLKHFNKIMSRNLAIMFYIDRVFIEWINKSLSNSYANLFDLSNSTVFTLKSGIINSMGGQVIVMPTHEKITGGFKIQEAAYVEIKDIAITEKDLFKNNIPNIDSILKHSDNLNHVLKILHILKITDKYKLKENISKTDISFKTIISDANSYIDQLNSTNNKKQIMKSNKNSGFYIKVYNDRAKAFFIDGENNQIHYIATNTNFNERFVSIRYYTFNIVNGKIKKI